MNYNVLNISQVLILESVTVQSWNSVVNDDDSFWSFFYYIAASFQRLHLLLPSSGRPAGLSAIRVQQSQSWHHTVVLLHGLTWLIKLALTCLKQLVTLQLCKFDVRTSATWLIFGKPKPLEILKVRWLSQNSLIRNRQKPTIA